MDEEIKILCVDDEKNVLKALLRLFMDEDYEILTAESGEEGLRILDDEAPVQLIISDYRMPGMNGVDFLKQVYERRPETIRIVLSGYADTGAIVAAINEGQIYKFIPKPWNDDDLKVTINKALETYFLARENRQLSDQLRKTNEELQILNSNLENLVDDRTAELTFKNRVLLRSQQILDALPVGVIGIDSQQNLVQCNSFGHRLLEADTSELLSRNFKKVLPEGLVTFISDLMEKNITCGNITLRNETFSLRGTLLHDNDDILDGVIVLMIPETCEPITT